jgi:hypothetical protein
MPSAIGIVKIEICQATLPQLSQYRSKCMAFTHCQWQFLKLSFTDPTLSACLFYSEPSHPCVMSPL